MIVEREQNEIEEVLGRCLTVGNLKRLIDKLDLCDDMPFLFVSDYGDHCHTEQALPLHDVEIHKTTDLRTTAYSYSGIKFLNPEDNWDSDRVVPEFDDDFERPVIIIQS